VPPRAAHVQRAQDNEDFYRNRVDLRVDVDRAWAVAVLFYAALHWVDAYLAALGHHPGDHLVRNGFVARDSTLRPIARHYLQLYNRSIDARYNLLPFTERQVRDLEVQRLLPIRAFLEPRVARPSP
jgi:hypothetical protein